MTHNIRERVWVGDSIWGIATHEPSHIKVVAEMPRMEPMTHDLRDALIDALRLVCANPEVAADACLEVIANWTAEEPQ